MSAAACAALASVAMLAGAGGAAAATVTVVAVPFGLHGDVPITGDWTGTGKTQIGVYRPSTEDFYLGTVQGAVIQTLHYGRSGDVPITGDWTGTGKTQIGAYRPSNLDFYLGDVHGAAPTVLHYGRTGDVPITGDWTGTGKTQIGVYRPSEQNFYLGDVHDDAPIVIHFGEPGDIPITGDWTGAGYTQIGVYRPSTETFYLREGPLVAPPSAPAAPVVSTPVISQLPAPHPRAHKRKPVSVTIKFSWTYDWSRTRLHWLRLGRLPRGARVSVSCTGRGCPRKRARTARAQGVGHLLRGLNGTVYRAGDRILITITAPGRTAERASITIRNKRRPVGRLL